MGNQGGHGRCVWVGGLEVCVCVDQLIAVVDSETLQIIT